jgi:hypothetical protein
MAAPTTTVRCPACGQSLRAVLAGGTATEWFPCPHCHRPVPVVLPRQPPPLYSWEVVAGLYPSLPLPRRPRWRSSSVVFAALLVVTILTLVLAGLLVYDGVRANGPGTFTIAGTVNGPGGFPGERPVAGASVVLHGENGFLSSATTDLAGRFAIAGVPAGGVNLTIRAPSYANASVVSFISSVYNASWAGLVVDLANASPAGSTTYIVLSPFPDMESFLASVGAGAALLILAGTIAALAARRVARPGGGALAVLGGGAGAGAPAAFYVLALATPFPWLTLGSAVAGGAGAFVIAVAAATLARGDAAPAVP